MRKKIVIGIGLVSLFATSAWVLHARAQGSADEAAAIVSTCADTRDRPACYEAQVPALYPKLSVPQIFEVVRQIRRDDPSYQFCHVLGHKIGERVVAEDPNAWVDAIPLNPSDGLCSNGFIHGVIGGRFRAEVLTDVTIEQLIPDFARACEARGGWKPTGFDRGTCYHGLGHLYDFITNANVLKALSLCARTAPGDIERICVEGVFMQIYQPLEPDDFALIAQMTDKPATTTVRVYCSQFTDSMYKSSCLSESWPYVRDSILNGNGAGTFCSGYPSAIEEKFCYQSISAIIGRMSLGNSAGAARACSNFPQYYQSVCYTGSAQAVLEENQNDAQKAVAVCQLAPGALADQCLQGLLQHAAFLFGSHQAQYNNFCSALPESLHLQCGT